MRPEALAAVDERFRLGADAHKEYRSSKDQPVRVEHLLQEPLVVILYRAGAGGVAGIALDTRCDLKVAQTNVFDPCACRLGAGQRSAQEQVAIALKPRTGGNSKHSQFAASKFQLPVCDFGSQWCLLNHSCYTFSTGHAVEGCSKIDVIASAESPGVPGLGVDYINGHIAAG